MLPLIASPLSLSEVSRRKSTPRTVGKSTRDVVPQSEAPMSSSTHAQTVSSSSRASSSRRSLLVSCTPYVRVWTNSDKGMQLPMIILAISGALGTSYSPPLQKTASTLSSLIFSEASSLQIPFCTIPAANILFPMCRSIPQPGVTIGWDDYLQLVKIQGSWVAEASQETSHYPVTLFRLSGAIHKVVYLADLYPGDSADEPYGESSSSKPIDLIGSSTNVTAEALRLYKDIDNMSSWYVRLLDLLQPRILRCLG